MSDLIIYRGNSDLAFEAAKPLPCPLCGNEPHVRFVGNDHTKKRSVQIKCSWPNGCGLEITRAGLKHDHQQVTAWALEAWNKRQEIKEAQGE